jgi:hypothetical protein
MLFFYFGADLVQIKNVVCVCAGDNARDFDDAGFLSLSAMYGVSKYLYRESFMMQISYTVICAMMMCLLNA